MTETRDLQNRHDSLNLITTSLRLDPPDLADALGERPASAWKNAANSAPCLNTIGVLELVHRALEVAVGDGHAQGLRGASPARARECPAGRRRGPDVELGVGKAQLLEVGTSGSAATRLSPQPARARQLAGFDVRQDHRRARSEGVQWPPRMAVSAGPAPAYGTWRSLMDAACDRSSIAHVQRAVTRRTSCTRSGPAASGRPAMKSAAVFQGLSAGTTRIVGRRR